MPKAICHEHIRYPLLFFIIFLMLPLNMCSAKINKRGLTDEQKKNLPLPKDFHLLPEFEIIRIWSSGSHGWLGNVPGKNKLTTKTTDHFSENINWELIPVNVTGKVFQLRHLKRKKYLCMNKKGKASLRKKPRKRACNLLIFHQKQYLYIVSQRTWFNLGFCRNHHPFIFGNSDRHKCSTKKLPKKWNKFLLCDKVPARCIPGCRKQIFHNPTCGYYCRNAVACRARHHPEPPKGLPSMAPWK